MSRAALWISCVFWLVMMALLVHVDVIPMYTVADSPQYSTVVKEVLTPVTREMAVYQGDQEVGTSQTIISPAADGSYRMVNITNVTVRIAMFESRVRAVLEVLLDSSKDLDTLSLKVSAGDKHADVSGIRVGDKVRLEVDLNGEVFTEEIPYENAMITSYFEPFALGGRLKVGQRWQTRFLDPLQQKTTVATVRVVGKERIDISMNRDMPPETVEAYRVVMQWGDIELNAWATGEGLILKEETPWGYTLVYRGSGENDTD